MSFVDLSKANATCKQFNFSEEKLEKLRGVEEVEKKSISTKRWEIIVSYMMIVKTLLILELGPGNAINLADPHATTEAWLC